MNNIFTYGSLMFDRVWDLVVGGSYRKVQATLKGYDRKVIRGEAYPAVYPSSILSQVQGIVYFDVSSTDLAKLDIFEGEYYFRREEQVITADAELVPAAVYVLKEEYYPVISLHDWEPERFETNGLHRFIDDYIGFGRGGKKLH